MSNPNEKMRTNDIVMQKDLFRLAALLYSETTSNYSSLETHLHIVKCIIAQKNNEYMGNDEIISAIIQSYKYNMSEEELERIISRSSKTFESITIDNQKCIRLIPSEFDKVSASLNKSIDYYIEAFINKNGISDHDLCRDAIYKYLYELTTSNINSYKILLFGETGQGLKEEELSVSVFDFSKDERNYVRSFLDWDDAEKNAVISNIVFCCLEYCLLVSGDKPSEIILKTIRNREIYLDTNIIFRALGINGASRKNVVIAFLAKCRQAKIKIIISRITKREFFDTITYYIGQIAEFPRGKIYNGAYESLSDYTIYSFYDAWLESHQSLSLKYFNIHIETLYRQLVSDFKITDEEQIPDGILSSIDFKKERDTYARSIQSTKNNLHAADLLEDGVVSSRHEHDASMVRIIENRRTLCNNDRDIYMVSSDKILRHWDMTRKLNGYPVVIYPSQLFLILIKMCGRSQNDFESFVSFINIRTNSQQLSPEKANAILSGISSITEDIKTQEMLVASVFDDEFQNVIKHSNTDKELYIKAQQISQKYLEKELTEKDAEIVSVKNEASLKDSEIKTLKENLSVKESVHTEQHQIIVNKENQLEEQRRKVTEFAEKKTQLPFLLKWNVLPVAIVLYSLFVIVFIGLQFFFGSAPWNFTNSVTVFIETTSFGTHNENSMGIIDSVLGMAMLALLRLLWGIKPWNKGKKNNDRAEWVEKYIIKNNLHS